MILYQEYKSKNLKIGEKYHLFLDDERFPDQVNWVDLPLHDWIIVRNYDEFVECTTEYGLAQTYSFDHDLGMTAYIEFNRCITENENFDYSRLKEKTGMDCVHWLVNYCISNNLIFPEYFVHSMNFIGKENIISLIESFKKFK